MADALSEARLQALEDFALDLARAAGAAILPLFRAQHGLENKAAAGAFDPVTAADKGAEAAIREALHARFPDHGVIGEEYGEDRPDAEFVWVLDPIDGTRAFVAGLPLWTSLIGLRHQGEPVVGLIAQPYLDEIFVGSGGRARRLRSGSAERLAVRPCPALTEAVIATTDPDLFTGAELGAWRQVRAAARIARFGCDAYAYAMVAQGTIDLVVEAGLNPWDIEAIVPVIEGAGGVVANWRGERLGRNGGQVAAAGDLACLEEALVALRRSAT
jgi:histidinol phosphatase-like enzyme (inositol monophosphatase family)